jgi:hypothetical protein
VYIEEVTAEEDCYGTLMNISYIMSKTYIEGKIGGEGRLVKIPICLYPYLLRRTTCMHGSNLVNEASPTKIYSSYLTVSLSY